MELTGVTSHRRNGKKRRTIRRLIRFADLYKPMFRFQNTEYERKGWVLLNMGVKCKYCGWQPEESSFYSTREDMKNVRDHINKCQKEHESQKHL